MSVEFTHLRAYRASMRLAPFVLAAISCVAVAQAQKPTAKVFIEDRVVHNGIYGSRNITLEMTRELLKRCPSVVSPTENSSSADVRLAITPGASTLYRTDGSVEHIFGVRWMVSRLAKEVCAYFESR